jgi:hypothetical protein
MNQAGTRLLKPLTGLLTTFLGRHIVTKFLGSACLKSGERSPRAKQNPARRER